MTLLCRDVDLVVVVGLPSTEWKLAQQVIIPDQRSKFHTAEHLGFYLALQYRVS